MNTHALHGLEIRCNSFVGEVAIGDKPIDPRPSPIRWLQKRLHQSFWLPTFLSRSFQQGGASLQAIETRNRHDPKGRILKKLSSVFDKCH